MEGRSFSDFFRIAASNTRTVPSELSVSSLPSKSRLLDWWVRRPASGKGLRDSISLTLSGVSAYGVA